MRSAYSRHYMLEKFYSDLAVPGCMIQLGTENNVIKSVHSFYDGELEQFLSAYCQQNLYFLGGVREDDSLLESRAKDTDISRKNYFYLDFDWRKEHPEYTDDQLKGEILKQVKDVLSDMGEPFASWRYIVYTGNGLHVYFFGTEPVEITDKDSWRYGVGSFLENVEKAFQEKLDRACVNAARIARMPGSFNCKGFLPKKCEIVAYQDRRFSLTQILERGANVAKALLETQKARATQLSTTATEPGDVYKAIDRIPVGKVMCLLKGWHIAKNGMNFVEDGDIKNKACFISTQGNFIVPGGSKHLPSDKGAYYPFNLVRTVLNLSNAQTFQWFEERFPEIRRASEHRDSGVTIEVSADYSIKNAFEELRGLKVRNLALSPEWDEWGLLERGSVTRIGATPGKGKSKLAYFFTHLLLQNEYGGLFFSTEVTTPRLLAHLLHIRLGKPRRDILEHSVDIPYEVEEDLKNLKVFDVRHTGNNLAQIERRIKMEKDKAEANEGRLDFVVIDFSQQVTPKSGKGKGGGIFDWATEWGNECQAIAQRYDIAFIDICQLSYMGHKDADAHHGHIPYEGGNKLVQTADVAAIFQREFGTPGGMDQCFLEVRKSKVMERGFKLTLAYSFKNGTFRLDFAEDQWSPKNGGVGTKNYAALRGDSIPKKEEDYTL